MVDQLGDLVSLAFASCGLQCEDGFVLTSTTQRPNATAPYSQSLSMAEDGFIEVFRFAE